MSMITRTTYMAKCDYPGCYMLFDFWSNSEENKTGDIINDEEWICLYTGDNQPRFFCPLHVRYMKSPEHDCVPVYYDQDREDKQTVTHALRKYYADVLTPQPLPRQECEDTILAILTSEDTK